MDAVIDIGSNSVRLLLAYDASKINAKKLNTTQLSKNLAVLGRLQDEAIIRTANAVADFFAEAKKAGANNVYIFGTEAMRNPGGEILKSLIESKIPAVVDIISGQEEATLGFFGATKGQGDCAVIDIGGASVELVSGNNGSISYAESLKLGVVRVRDVVGDDEGAIKKFYSQEIKNYKKVTAKKLIAIGGTATTLASMLLHQKVYDAKEIHEFLIKRDKLAALSDEIFNFTANSDISALTAEFPTVSEKRALVIGHGAVLLLLLMDYLGFDCVTVSEHDNMEGYLAKKVLL